MRNGRSDSTVRSGAHRLGNPHDLVDSNITERGIGNLRWNPEDCHEKRVNQSVDEFGRRSLTPLGNGTSTRVGTIQTSHEADGVAAQVYLVVEGSLGEDSSLAGVEGVADKSRPVLLDETDFEVRSGHHV